jgi:hypothetical protein
MAGEGWPRYDGLVLRDWQSLSEPERLLVASKARLARPTRRRRGTTGPPRWGSVASRIGRLIPWELHYKYDAQVNKHQGLPPPGRS